MECPTFEVIVKGIILDTTTKKVLIGKWEDKNSDEKDWCFPGGRLLPGEDIDKSLKRLTKIKTGYSVKNIGTFFSQTHEEYDNRVSIYFLTEIFEGNETAGDDIKELKWINIKEIENYFTHPLHVKLKEFLFELV